LTSFSDTLPSDTIDDTLDFILLILYIHDYNLLRSIDNKLNFLEFSVLIIDSQKIIFNTYHKAIFSERFLNFHSNHLFCHKKDTIIILCYVDKIVQLSHPRFQHKNLTDAIHIFLNNGYPFPLIFSTIDKRLKFQIQNKYIIYNTYKSKKYISTNQRKIFHSSFYVKSISENFSLYPTYFLVN